MLSALSAIDLGYAAAVLLLAYFVRGISGFGSGLIAVPLLALRFPLQAVVPFMLLTDFASSALIGGRNYQHVERSEIKRLLPASLLGVVLGTSLLVALPSTVLLSVLATFIAAFALRSLLLRNDAFQPVSTLWAWPAGLLGGSVGAMFGTGGPPYVIYLGHRIADKAQLRATFSGLFFVEGLVRIATFLAAGLLLDTRIWLAVLLAAPLIGLALYAGSHVHTRLSQRQMQVLISLLLLVSAASLLIKAWQPA
jgi:uncharacterized membrane protein YfcA